MRRSTLPIMCLLLVMTLVSAKAAYADIVVSYNDVTTQWIYSGTYMFTVSGNDSQILRNDGTSAEALQLLQYMNNWFDDNTNLGSSYLDYLAAYDKYADGFPSEKLFVEYGNLQRYGSWTSDAAIEFYVVKAGNSFALYWLGEDGLASGTWTAEHVALVGKGNIPELSHFTGYNPKFQGLLILTPEPSSILLLGLGAFALILMYRKRRRA